MSYDVIPTLCVAILALFTVQGVTVYAVVKLLVTGRTLIEKRPLDESGHAQSSWRP